MKIAVIPARGGSKRIPKKNITSFAGKPIMGWALLAVGGAILLGLERRLEGWLLDVMPLWLQDLSVAF